MRFNTIIGFAIGPVISGLLGLITIPIIAWYFSPEDVGRFNIFQVSLSFFLLFGTLALDQSYVREYHASNDKHQLLKECFLPGFILQVAVVVMVVYYGEFISTTLFKLDGAYYSVMVSVCVLINFSSRFLSLILRMKEKGLDYSLSQVTPKLVQVIILLIVARFIEVRDFAILIAIACAAFLINLSILILQNKNEIGLSLSAKVNDKNLVNYFKFGFPLIFSGLLYWGISASTTFSLKNYSSLNELAVFSVAMSFSTVAAIAQSIFATIWTPLAFKWQESGVDMKKVDEVSDGVLILICLIASVAGVFSFVIEYFLPPQYANVKYIFSCLVLLPLLYIMSTVTSIGIGIMRANKFSLLASIGALLVNIVFCFLLVDEYGAAGGAISNLLSFLTLFIINTESSVYVWRYFPRLKIYLSISLIIFFAILNALPYFHDRFNFNIVWGFILIGFSVAFRIKLRSMLLLGLRYIKKLGNPPALPGRQ